MAIPLAIYAPESLLKSDAASAARLSTIVPLYSKEMLAGKWNIAFHSLMLRWRSRIRTFRAHEVIKGKRYLVSANCLPHAVNLKNQPESPRFCGRDDLCPWCHMRQVHDTYDFVDTIMRAEIEKEPKLKLYSLRRIKRVPDDQFGFLSQRLTRIQKEAMSAAYVHQKTSIGGPGRAIGTMWIATVAPGVGRYRKTWEVTGRSLVLMSREEVLIRPEKWTSSSIEEPNSDHLQKAVAAFLKYPSGLLRANPDKAVLAIRLKTTMREEMKMHFSGRGGAFRSSKEK